MHSSNSTVMAAAARGAHWHEDPGAQSGIPGQPSRAALGARPLRNEAAAPPPRPACHRRGASPKSAARPRRPLSPLGSVAKYPLAARDARCHCRGASPKAPMSRPLRLSGPDNIRGSLRTPRGPAIRPLDNRGSWQAALSRTVARGIGGGGRGRVGGRGSVQVCAGPWRPLPGPVLCTRSLSPAPPLLPLPRAALGGCLSGAKAQARQRPGAWCGQAECARVRRPTCAPNPPGAPGVWFRPVSLLRVRLEL